MLKLKHSNHKFKQTTIKLLNSKKIKDNMYQVNKSIN